MHNNGPEAVATEVKRIVGGNKVYLTRSEEHTSELQSHHGLVCRLLLEQKKTARASRIGKRWA